MRNNGWTVEFAAKKALEYNDAEEISSWKMAIGYSGIGKGKIILNQINIED